MLKMAGLDAIGQKPGWRHDDALWPDLWVKGIMRKDRPCHSFSASIK